MQFWQYLIVSIASFLGIGAGLALSYIAKEELKPGKLFINIIPYFLFAIAGLTFGLAFHSIFLGLGIPVISIGIGLLIKNYASYFHMAVWTLLLGMAKPKDTAFSIVASLIFIYGYVIASNWYEDNFGTKDKDWKEFKGQLISIGTRYSYFLLTIVLYFLF